MREEDAQYTAAERMLLRRLGAIEQRLGAIEQRLDALAPGVHKMDRHVDFVDGVINWVSRTLLRLAPAAPAAAAAAEPIAVD